ncbi:MAG: hypothetical protein RL692_1011 [Planctomycetota bacterium]
MTSVRLQSNSTVKKSPAAKSKVDLAARRDELWLLELTSTPTAAGHEERVMAWIDGWLAPRRSKLDIQRDDAGNFLIRRKDRSRSARPILITAHLDHPAFVVLVPPSIKGPAASRRNLTIEFRGGVNDPYFVGARIEVIDYSGSRFPATIITLDAKQQPYKRVVARLDQTPTSNSIAVGDIARWLLPAPRIVTRAVGTPMPSGEPTEVRVIETNACDDLAAVAAACAAFDRLMKNKAAVNVGLLFTVAEEVGFIGAIHAAKTKFIPRNARLICLENSRSFPHDSPIGAGPILRVGDRMSVFSPTLTNELSFLFTAHRKKRAGFKWQRKLMAGGGCEATAFAAYGFESTCLCLALGHYHNMSDIDGVLAGKRPAKIECEFVSIDDYHGLIEMLIVGTTGLAAIDKANAKRRTPAISVHLPVMEMLYRRSSSVLGG